MSFKIHLNAKLWKRIIFMIGFKLKKKKKKKKKNIQQQKSIYFFLSLFFYLFYFILLFFFYYYFFILFYFILFDYLRTYVTLSRDSQIQWSNVSKDWTNFVLIMLSGSY